MKLFQLSALLDLKPRTGRDYIAWTLCVVTLGISVFLALHLDIYYDEAYTYRGTGNITGFYKTFLFRLANTHVLNSLLMALTTVAFPYSEWAIRLPSLLFALAYVILAYSLSKQFAARFLVLGLLLFFDHLVLFHSLGRGYGMSATLVLLSIWFYYRKAQITNWPLAMAWTLLLAFYANFAALPYVICFSAYLFVAEFNWQFPAFRRKTWLWLAILLTVGLFGFYKVSQTAKPLFGAYEAGFFEAIAQNLAFHFTQSLSPDLTTVTVLTLITAALMLVVYFRSGRRFPLGVVTILTFALIFLLARLAHKPLPTGRVLLPFWPLLVAAFAEMLQYAAEKVQRGKNMGKVFDLLLSGLLLYNMVVQIPFSRIYSGAREQWRAVPRVLAFAEWPDRAQAEFYLQKDRYYHNSLEALQKTAPNAVKEKPGARLEIYRAHQLALIFVQDADEEAQISKTVFRKGQQNRYRLSLADSGYALDSGRIYLQTLYHKKGDSVRIAAPDQRWSFTLKLRGTGPFRPPNIIPWEARSDYYTGSNNPPKD